MCTILSVQTRHPERLTRHPELVSGSPYSKRKPKVIPVRAVPPPQGKSQSKLRTSSTPAPLESPTSDGCRAYPTPVRAVLEVRRALEPSLPGSIAGTPLHHNLFLLKEFNFTGQCLNFLH